jgi:aspartyl-tRNA(Asn)/glutamyl-tRNA(Gln) amidotransferase subunit A
MNSTNSLADLSPVTELVRQMQAGELTSVQLTQACLARIERFDATLHAFIAVYADDALAVAAAADRAIAAGHALGPLHGIPVAVKDIIDIEGRVTTGGSKVWENRISPVTAKVVWRLIGAGMIVLGKTHTVEFAMGSFGTNRHLGTPWNPWDLAQHRIPGGSSAGSAVAVAAGLAPWAIGTDTGGSVRLPASFCGLVGLKTTIGRVSRHGVLPLSSTLDTVGPICRSVEDAAVLYDVLRGSDENDPITLRQPSDYPCHSLRGGVAGLRLARLPAAERERADADVLAAYDASLDVLAGLGAEMLDVSLPRSFDEMGRLVGRIIGAEGYSFVGHLVDDPSLPLDDDVRPRIQVGREMSARDYLLVLREQQAIKREFDAALDGVDALLTPTTATAAPLVSDVDQSGTAAHFTRPVNLIEACALALPNGFTSTGLPTSLQIICRGFQESLALRIGWAYEQATDWHKRRPDGLDLFVQS